jgi:hypothetical protein
MPGQFLTASDYACRCPECVPLGLIERVTGQIAARVIRAGARAARIERKVRAWWVRTHDTAMVLAVGLDGESEDEA